MSKQPLSEAKSRLYSLKNRAPDAIKAAPPWVWVAIIGFVLLTVATVAVLAMRNQGSSD